MIASRSMVVRSGIRVASPLAVIVGMYLFFAGHNQPGGGFAAGLVFGAVVALRSVAGLPTPQHPVRLMALGGVIAGLVAVAPLLFGHTLLDMVVVDAELPVLGKVKAGSALVFDLGVTLIVVGLLVAILSALGVGDLGADRLTTDRNIEASRCAQP